MSGNVHVVPSDGGWDVTVEGGRGAKRFATQNEAIEAGERLARGHRSQRIVHGRDGRIRQRDTYGRGPFPSRD